MGKDIKKFEKFKNLLAKNENYIESLNLVL